MIFLEYLTNKYKGKYDFKIDWAFVKQKIGEQVSEREGIPNIDISKKCEVLIEDVAKHLDFKKGVDEMLEQLILMTTDFDELDGITQYLMNEAQNDDEPQNDDANSGLPEQNDDNDRDDEEDTWAFLDNKRAASHISAGLHLEEDRLNKLLKNLKEWKKEAVKEKKEKKR